VLSRATLALTLEHGEDAGPPGQEVRVEDQGLLTVADAAARLGRSTEQVRRYLREKRLHGRRIGGQWFIAQSELDAFSERQRERHGFLDKIRPASELDPFAGLLGIGRGGGSNIAEGKEAYRRAFRWRR
jgi:excisionase family DNA binding protein